MTDVNCAALEVKIYLTQRMAGDAEDIRFYKLRILNKEEKGGAGSAPLIGTTLAPFRKGRDKGVTNLNRIKITGLQID